MSKQQKKLKKFITPEDIQAEFELATTGQDFSGTNGKAFRQLLYTYFVTGALWSQSVLVSQEIWVPRSPEELAQAKKDTKCQN